MTCANFVDFRGAIASADDGGAAAAALRVRVRG